MAILSTDDAKHSNSFHWLRHYNRFFKPGFCSEHFISIKHRILATFNTNKKFNSDSLYAFKIEKLQNRNIIIIYHSLTFCFIISHLILGGRRGGDRMVVGFTTAYAISAYHHWCCEFESRPGRGVQHYVIKFVSDLRQIGGFLRVLPFPPPIKLTTIK
jgi:hypothetical protein